MKNKLKTTIIVTSLAVTALHGINRCVGAAATVRGLLSETRGKRYNWRFGSVYYTVQGSGKPLLLLHNIDSCASSYEWSHLVNHLAKNHTVYTLDLLGCGRSDKPNITYTNFLYVQLISDFIKNIIKERTDVAVSGLTTSCVIMACQGDSELFENIMLINPESMSKLLRVPGKNGKIVKFLMDLPIIGTSVYYMINSKSNVEYRFTEKYFFNPFHLSQKGLDIFYESSHLGGPGGKYLLSSISGLYLTVNIKKALAEINNNIYIVGGKHLGNIENILSEYTAINPSIEVGYIENTKQLPQLENPEELYDIMNIFFYK